VKKVPVVLTAAVALTGCGIAFGSTSDSPVSLRAPYTVEVPVTGDPDVARTQQYTVTYTSVRRDGEPAFYVVVDPVDVSESSFRIELSAVITDLAHKVGSPIFSAFVFDSPLLAAQPYQESYGIFGNENMEFRDTFANKLSRHQIVTYIGADIDTPPGTSLRWFPTADNDTMMTGQWKSTTDWNPLPT
jgi:hypothetical protein